MKTLITILLLIPVISFSQQCSSIDKIISIQGGVPANISFEGGVQGDKFGIFVGAKGTVYTKKGNEVYPASQNFNLNPYVKGSLNIFGGDDDFIRAYLIGYVGTGKIHGAGIKLGAIASDYVMVFVEPMYGENKFEGNIGISFRF